MSIRDDKIYIQLGENLGIRKGDEYYIMQTRDVSGFNEEYVKLTLS